MSLNKNINRIILVIAIIAATSLTALAQGPGFDPGVTDTPVDGGATMMLIAAAGYGAKKLSSKKRKR